MRSAFFLLLAVALLAAPSCAVYYEVGKFTGLISPPVFTAKGQMPDDFKVSIDVRDVADPPIDYVYTFGRDGKATYDVTVRSPRRREGEGQFEISEDQITALWRAVATAGFDKLDARYPKSGEGPDKPNGVQKYYVYGKGTEYRVESHFQTNAALDSIRKAVLSVVPKEIAEGKRAEGAAYAGGGAPKEFVADMASKFFHRPDCPKLKDVPAANRQPFPTQWEAVNYGFKPCPECDPMRAK